MIQLNHPESLSALREEVATSPRASQVPRCPKWTPWTPVKRTFFRVGTKRCRQLSPLGRALGAQPKLHRQHRSLSHTRGDASIRTGLIHLVFHLVTVERSGASLARNRPPRGSTRAFHRHRLPPAGGRAANKCGGKRCSAGCKLLEQPELQALACQYHARCAHAAAQSPHKTSRLTSS